MKCPECGSVRIRVTDTRHKNAIAHITRHTQAIDAMLNDTNIVRHRLCVACQSDWWTIETNIDPATLPEPARRRGGQPANVNGAGNKGQVWGDNHY